MTGTVSAEAGYPYKGSTAYEDEPPHKAECIVTTVVRKEAAVGLYMHKISILDIFLASSRRKDNATQNIMSCL